MSEGELRVALGAYTRNIGYLLNMQEGAARIDLSGNPVDVVSAEHAAGPAKWAKDRIQRKQERARARKEAERQAAEAAAHQRYVEAWETIGKLAAAHPLAFFMKGHKRRPLGLDIVNDLVATGAMGTVDMLENAVRLYTRSLGYLKSLKEGAARVNLAGEPTGSLVTADEAAEAAAAVIACKARMERRRQERQAAEPQLPAPVQTVAPPIQMVVQPTVAPAQPQRIGLADLKTSALARRQLESAT